MCGSAFFGRELDGFARGLDRLRIQLLEPVGLRQHGERHGMFGLRVSTVLNWRMASSTSPISSSMPA